ncbi:MAG: YdcF family protein [Pseudanabaena sp. M046S1SP1A06QC]|nr:YdcF family protein [Pseudanabaena sp. M046S1SP1A06QC]
MINPFHSKSSMTALSGLIGSGCMIFGLPCLPPILASISVREPQAILVLGGSPAREKFAAQFALQHPKLPIFVSSGSPEEYAQYVFDSAGVDRSRIHLDYRAVDTVSNFTIMVSELQKRNITDVYIITSDFHMPRALVIGKIVLGSRGIEMYPVTIPSTIKSENPAKSLRDGLRSVFWLVTGS